MPEVSTQTDKRKGKKKLSEVHCEFQNARYYYDKGLKAGYYVANKMIEKKHNERKPEILKHILETRKAMKIKQKQRERMAVVSYKLSKRKKTISYYEDLGQNELKVKARKINEKLKPIDRVNYQGTKENILRHLIPVLVKNHYILTDKITDRQKRTYNL